MPRDPTNLGELEFALLEHIWSHGGCDVKVAHRAVGAPREITLNTVQSAMKRLWEKALLKRKKEGHAYVYSAAVNRRELTEMMVGQLVDQVAGSRMDVALQAFVSLAHRAGTDTLDTLEELIARQRAQEETEDGENS